MKDKFLRVKLYKPNPLVMQIIHRTVIFLIRKFKKRQNYKSLKAITKANTFFQAKIPRK